MKKPGSLKLGIVPYIVIPLTGGAILLAYKLWKLFGWYSVLVSLAVLVIVSIWVFVPRKHLNRMFFWNWKLKTSSTGTNEKKTFVMNPFIPLFGEWVKITFFIVITAIAVVYFWNNSNTISRPKDDDPKDTFRNYKTLTYGTVYLEKDGKYKILMGGSYVTKAGEYYITPIKDGTVTLTYAQIGSESQVYWSYNVTRDRIHQVHVIYDLVLNQNNGAGGWISVNPSESGHYEITPNAVLY